MKLEEVTRAMVAKDVGAVLVLDEDGLAGILTERDVMRAVADGLGPDTRVSDRMTPNPETLDASDTTDHAAMLMIHGGFRHLPVVEEGKVVGMLSIRDLMRIVLEDTVPRGV
jgi:CBS domain-containing protein